MSITVDEFTERCIQRARASVRNSPEVSAENVGVLWETLLPSIIQAAMLAIMDSLGSCGKTSTSEKLALINSNTVASRYRVHLAVNRAIAEKKVSWKEAASLRVASREAILEEAKETPDEELVPVLEEVDSYHFDANGAWGFAG